MTDQTTPVSDDSTPDETNDASTNDALATDPSTETLGGTEGGADSAVKDPDTWVTGDEPMTAPQRSYLDTLAREAGEELSANLTKAEASEQIDRLQAETGRGQ